jgi:anti-sigma factor RsiW
MDGVLSHEDHEALSELLGAYALDALEPDEADRVAAHLPGCPRCAAEVAQHHEVAGLLANTGGTAPADLWDRISARIDRPAEGESPRPLPSLPGSPGPTAGILPFRPSPLRRRWVRVGTAGVGAVAAALIVALVVQVGSLDNQVGQLKSDASRSTLSQVVTAALLNPAARRVALLGSSARNQTAADIVILPSGSAFLVNSSGPGALAPLPSGQTYQLWGLANGQLVSLGLLGSQPGAVAFNVDPSARITTFAVTAEVAGGVVTSSHTPVAQGSLLSA